MSTAQTLILGAIAGFTIFLGLPVGRMRGLSPGVRTFLNALAIGVLVFLLIDILGHATGEGSPIEEAISDKDWGELVGLSALLTAGLGVGLLTLVYYDKILPRRRSVGAASVGPGAASVQEFQPASVTDPARRLAILIAVGIGLHNFAEGLAIGQAAAKDLTSLAVLLVIGFGLHNATEGFGIVGPLAGQPERPSWGFLTVLGLIGGGPTFVGTVVGRGFTSDPVSVLFLALAAGSILYVVIQMVGVVLRSGHKEMLYWGVFLGLLLGFATDFVIEAAGV